MPNTNFQTIHQMDSAINSFVKQATGRDNVQNIDMEHITVAQNHYYEDVDISGRVVSFNAGAAGIPLDKCLVQIEPVQEGTGDPSPDNVRPISGWAEAKVFVSPTTDEADGTTYTIAFPAEAGTVYGGTLDVTTGELVVDRASVDISTLDYSPSSPEKNVFRANSLRGLIRYPQTGYDLANAVCSSFSQIAYVPLSSSDNGKFAVAGTGQPGRVVFIDKRYATVADFVSGNSGVQLVYELANPLTYQLTPQQVHTLFGANNIWADAGDIEVKFKNIKEFF